ncbi:hypothetical protein H0X10_02565 [Candidatus Saccharibacteria bacterium]|nr:hypothetical protein [Candidatus Saccharibacteria bacterium]
MRYESEALAERGWEHSYLEICFQHARTLQDALHETDNNSDATELRAEFIPVINEHYPYFQQSVYISGAGIFPATDEEGSIVSEEWGYSEGCFGIHQGFVVLDVAPEGSYDYHVMQKIFVQEIHSASLATVETEQRIYKYFDLNSQVIPSIEMESILSSYELQDDDPKLQLAMINEYSKRFTRLLRSTEFRRLKHRQQKRVVDDILVGVNQQVGVRDLKFMGEPEYGYAPFMYGTQRGFVALGLEEIIVGGSCLGIDSIESAFLRTKAIRKDNDMADKDAGLCMIVDPDYETRKSLYLTDCQVLYIPTLDQTFDVLLYPEA